MTEIDSSIAFAVFVRVVPQRADSGSPPAYITDRFSAESFGLLLLRDHGLAERFATTIGSEPVRIVGIDSARRSRRPRRHGRRDQSCGGCAVPDVPHPRIRRAAGGDVTRGSPIRRTARRARPLGPMIRSPGGSEPAPTRIAGRIFGGFALRLNLAVSRKIAMGIAAPRPLSREPSRLRHRFSAGTCPKRRSGCCPHTVRTGREHDRGDVRRRRSVPRGPDVGVGRRTLPAGVRTFA